MPAETQGSMLGRSAPVRMLVDTIRGRSDSGRSGSIGVVRLQIVPTGLQSSVAPLGDLWVDGAYQMPHTSRRCTSANRATSEAGLPRRGPATEAPPRAGGLRRRAPPRTPPGAGGEGPSALSSGRTRLSSVRRPGRRHSVGHGQDEAEVSEHPIARGRSGQADLGTGRFQALQGGPTCARRCRAGHLERLDLGVIVIGPEELDPPRPAARRASTRSATPGPRLHHPDVCPHHYLRALESRRFFQLDDRRPTYRVVIMNRAERQPRRAPRGLRSCSVVRPTFGWSGWRSRTRTQLEKLTGGVRRRGFGRTSGVHHGGVRQARGAALGWSG